MDIRDEIKASKVDKSTQLSLLPDSNVLPKSSLLPDSDQNNLLNKPQLSSGVKGIDHVSPIKSNDTGNSDSSRHRRITMSERDMLLPSNAQPVSQFNPITGELIMSSANVNFSVIVPVVSDKLTDLEKDKVNVEKDKGLKHKLTDLEKNKVNVGKDKAPKHKASVKNPTDVVYKARKQKTPVKKPDAVVDKAPSKKPDFVVVQDKDNVMALAKEPASVIVQDKDNVVVNDPAELNQEKDNEKHKAPAKEPVSVVGRVSDVVNDSVVVESVCDVVKASNALKNKATVAKEKSDGKGMKSTVDKDNDKASDALKNKATDVKKKSVGKGNKSTVDKPKVNAPNPKDNKSKAHSDVVPVAEKSKPNPKQKEKSTVQELSEVPVLRSSNQKVNPDVMSKVVVLVSRSKETHVKRKMIVSNEDDRKKKLKGKSKKEDSDSELETDVGDSSDDEVDQKRKKLKIKAGLKRKTSGSDSSSIDTTKVKRLVSKLEKKVKKQESDEESVPKKGKKKEKQLTPEQAAHEEYLSTFPSLRVRTTRSFLFSAIKNSRVNILRFLTDIGFSSLHNVSIDQLPSKLGWFVVSMFESYMLSLDSGDKIEVTSQKILDMLGVPVGGYSLFDLDEREANHEFVKLWVGQFYPVELRDHRVNDIARKLVAAKEIDFLFKVNHLTLFTNTMGKADRLKGQICLDVVRRLRKDSVISDTDGCGYIYDCLRGSKLLPGTNHYIGPLTFLILLYLDLTKFDRFPVLRTRPSIRNWSTYLMKQRHESELKNHVLGLLDLHVEWTEAEVQDAEGFIGSLEISRKEDLIKKAEEKLSLICSERVMLEDYMRKASLKCPGDGKFVALHEKYVNLFKDPISFKDDGNGDNVGDDDDENGDDDDGNVDEEDVNEGDKDPNGSNPSFGFSKISLKDFGNDRGPAKKDKVVEGNPTEQGTVVEGNQDEECEIMSTPENFTQWLDKNVDLVGEGDLFGDNSASLELMNQEIIPEKLPTQKASPSPKKRAGKPSSYLLSPYMNKKTNVVPKITRLEFILGNSLFAMQGDKIENVFEAHVGKFSVYGIRLNLETLAPGLWLDANWESFSNQVNAQFKGNKGGLALGGIDLVFFPICKSEHFYMVVFSLTKTTAMTILDNIPGTYDSKYKDVCDLLVARVKHTIPKLKWKTKENFHDCGIFTLLHMETFDGGPASNLDCWLPVESQLQRDILRRLRFKFAMKILLHEINVHAGKMLELAKEFDKTDRAEKMMIIVDALKNREECDCI
ncbi:vacuolar-sorting receptor 1-like protein [Tanacetum coccineum]